MTIVRETEVPTDSMLSATVSTADFYDAYSAPLQNGALSPAEIFLQASRATPKWVSRLMAIRNRIVRQIGLKDVGNMNAAAADKTASAYRVGDRLGIFSIFAMTEDELLLGIDDKHLDVRVSVFKDGRSAPSYVVSTVVHVHNLLGHLYMVPVGRIHPLVVRAMMRRGLA
jgi:Protein of unknown function (DUF2867)